MKRSHTAWRFSAVLIGVLSLAGTLHSQDAALPPDLALVPADALGFVHVRLKDIWASEHFNEWRDTILKAGDKAVAAFDKRFFPTPSSIDRITLVVQAPQAGQHEPVILGILTTSRPIDREGLVKYTLAGSTPEKVGGKTLYVDAKMKTEVTIVSDTILAFGNPGAVRAALEQPPSRQGPLSEALALAKTGKTLVIALNSSALPPAALREVPPPFQPILRARLAMLTLDLKGQGQVDLSLNYATPRQTEEAEEAARAGLNLARKFVEQGKAILTTKVLGDGKPGSLEELPEAAGSLVGLGALNRLDEFLAAPPLKKEGNALLVSSRLPQGGAMVLSMGAISTGLLLPAVQKVREAASRTQDQNNLKQIALAFHNYHDTYRGLPPAAICDKAGKPLLSWRVAILPFIEQDNLYRQFKLDEPWDSEHNRKLIPLMSPIYALPNAPSKPGETHYRVFVGNGALFDLDKKVGFNQITDGLSNTLLVVETADGVPWTKPEDISYNPKAPLPKFGNFYQGGFNAAFGDGSVRYFSPTVAEATLRAMITRGGGEVIPIDQR